MHTYFVEHEHEALALRFTPAHLLLYQPTATPSRVACIEDEEYDIRLADDFV
jgi:hypothetical protein